MVNFEAMSETFLKEPCIQPLNLPKLSGGT